MKEEEKGRKEEETKKRVTGAEGREMGTHG